MLGRLRVLEKYLFVSGADGLSLDFLGGLTALASSASSGARGALYQNTYSLIVRESRGMSFSSSASLSLQQLYSSASATGSVILDGADGGFCTTNEDILSTDAGLWWAFTGTKLQLSFDPSLCPNATCALLSDGQGGCSNLCDAPACEKICAAPGPLQSAAEVQAFFTQTGALDHPCDYLNGDLILRGVAADALPLLDRGFQNLKRITGGLVIEENEHMLTLDLLSSLEQVRSIFLTNNDVLVDARLPRLHPGADVILGFNPYLCDTATPYGTAPCNVVVVVGGTVQISLSDEGVKSLFQTSAVGGVLVEAARASMAKEAGNDILARIITASVDVVSNGRSSVLAQFSLSVQYVHAAATEDALVNGLRRYFLAELLKQFDTEVTAVDVSDERPPRLLDEERTTGTSTLRLRVGGVSASGILLAWDRIVAEGEEALPLDLLLRYRPAASSAQLSQLEGLLLRETKNDLVVPFSSEREEQIIANVPAVFDAMVPWRTMTVSGNITHLFIAACQFREQSGVAAETTGLTDHLQGSPCIVPESIFEFELRGLQRNVAAARERSRPLILESNTVSQQLPVSPLVPLGLAASAASGFRVDVAWRLSDGLVASYVELQISYAASFDAAALEDFSQAKFERELLVESTLERVQLALSARGRFTLSGCWQAVPVVGAGEDVTPERHCISAFTLYRVRVVVRAPGLQSGASFVYVATRPERPASPPRNVTVVAASARSATVHFKLPSDPRGVVEAIDVDVFGESLSNPLAEAEVATLSSRHYVRHDRLPISSTALLQAQAPDASFAVTIGDLLPYHTYVLRVRARTAGGAALTEHAALVHLRTAETQPGKPQRVQLRAVTRTGRRRSADQEASPLELLWQMPQPPLGRIVHFDVEFAALNTSAQVVTLNASGVVQLPSGTYVFDLPVNGTTDLVLARVRAETAVGYGEWSAQAVPFVAPSSSSPILDTATAGAIGGGVALLLLVVALVGAVILRRRKREVMFFAPPADEFEIDRGQLNLGSTLGSGAYGEVYDATAVGLMGNPNATRVAVKQCHAHSATVQAKRAFIEEMQIMKVRAGEEGRSLWNIGR